MRRFPGFALDSRNFIPVRYCWPRNKLVLAQHAHAFDSHTHLHPTHAQISHAHAAPRFKAHAVLAQRGMHLRRRCRPLLRGRERDLGLRNNTGRGLLLVVASANLVLAAKWLLAAHSAASRHLQTNGECESLSRSETYTQRAASYVYRTHQVRTLSNGWPLAGARTLEFKRAS